MANGQNGGGGRVSTQTFERAVSSQRAQHCCPGTLELEILTCDEEKKNVSASHIDEGVALILLCATE